MFACGVCGERVCYPIPINKDGAVVCPHCGATHRLVMYGPGLPPEGADEELQAKGGLGGRGCLPGPNEPFVAPVVCRLKEEAAK